jgi:hypothetical protein
MYTRWRRYGRSFDLGKMNLGERFTAYASQPAIHVHLGSAHVRRRSPHVFNLGYDIEESKKLPWVAELSGGPARDRPPANQPRTREIA